MPKLGHFDHQLQETMHCPQGLLYRMTFYSRKSNAELQKRTFLFADCIRFFDDVLAPTDESDEKAFVPDSQLQTLPKNVSARSLSQSNCSDTVTAGRIFLIPRLGIDIGTKTVTQF